MRRLRARTQQGFSMLEMLVTLVISSLVIIPVLAWMVIGYRTQDDLQRRSHDDRIASFLSQYFPRDVQTASAAATGGTPCGSGGAPVVAVVGTTTTLDGVTTTTTPPSPPPTVVLTLANADQGSGDTRTVYSIVERPDGTGSLWRTRCENTSNSVTSQNLLAEGLVRPTGGWSQIVACSTRAGLIVDPCGRVTLTVKARSGAPVAVSASRRTGPPR